MKSLVLRTDSLSVSAQSPILEADRLRRITHEGTVLLDDVSLSVHAGEAVGILGPPGAGKTLLLRALALLDPLDGGEVRFLGCPVAAEAVPDFRRKVLYVQQRAISVEGTVRDNLLLPFLFESARSRSFDEDRIGHWLESVGRSDQFLDRSVADLSGGELQIVSLLRALQIDPAVILLDEPTSSLDDRTRMQVESLLSAWLQRPPVLPTAARCLVIVTHDETQAERICHRRVRLADGSIVKGATMEQGT